MPIALSSGCAPRKTCLGICHAPGAICNPPGPRRAAGRLPAERERYHVLLRSPSPRFQGRANRPNRPVYWNLESIADRRPPSWPRRNGGSPSGSGRLVAYVVEAKSPNCAGAIVRGDDRWRGQTIWIERRAGQSIARLAARAMGAVPGRPDVSRLRGIVIRQITPCLRSACSVPRTGWAACRLSKCVHWIR